MAAPRIARALRIAGFVILLVLGLVILGTVQGVVLQFDRIETTTTTPDPATAIAILAVMVILLGAAVVTFVVWLRRQAQR